MSETRTYAVQVDWATVAPRGDTLVVRTEPGCDDRWVEAFEAVLDEHEHQRDHRKWRAIDFEYSSDEEARFALLVKGIEPEAESVDVRREVTELVGAANTVARVGTHVYELARELRQAQPAVARGSVPPPAFDPLADELDADAA